MSDENGRGVLGSGTGDSGQTVEERFGEDAVLEPSETVADQEATDDVDQPATDYSSDYAADQLGDLDAEPSDATHVADIDWLSLWGLAGITADERISRTQAILAVETSDQTGVGSAAQAAEVVDQAVERSLLVARRIEGAIVDVQLAPHLLDGDR